MTFKTHLSFSSFSSGMNHADLGCCLFALTVLFCSPLLHAHSWTKNALASSCTLWLALDYLSPHGIDTITVWSLSGTHCSQSVADHCSLSLSSLVISCNSLSSSFWLLFLPLWVCCSALNRPHFYPLPPIRTNSFHPITSYAMEQILWSRQLALCTRTDRKHTAICHFHHLHYL